jgi:hypothetical protein
VVLVWWGCRGFGRRCDETQQCKLDDIEASDKCRVGRGPNKIVYPSNISKEHNQKRGHDLAA